MRLRSVVLMNAFKRVMMGVTFVVIDHHVACLCWRPCHGNGDETAWQRLWEGSTTLFMIWCRHAIRL